MSELNAEIARALGWTDIRPGEHFISSVVTGIPPKASYGWREKIPAYDTDPAAALTLLEHVLSIQTHQLECSDMLFSRPGGSWKVTIYDETNYYECEGDTLSLAIALACRDALIALRGAAGGTETP